MGCARNITFTYNSNNNNYNLHYTSFGSHYIFCFSWVKCVSFFQLNQRDAHASTTAGSTRMVRASVPAVNTSAPASMALLAALLSVTTSCHRLLHPAPTHDWSGSPVSAASAWTAIRAPGGSHQSIRFGFFLKQMSLSVGDWIKWNLFWQMVELFI